MTACYVVCALVGALLGRQHYLPIPPTLGDGLVISDLRYAGAIAGAMVGAVSAAGLVRWWSDLRAPLAINAVLLTAVGLLGYVLCETNVLLGGFTTLIMALPWLIAVWTVARRSASK